MGARLSSTEKEKRRAIRDARSIIQQAEKSDVNEAETRRRIERIFENVMGFDPFTHLSRERAVRGAGETEHVDFAVHVEGGEDAKPVVMVEIKRVAVDLARKHLKQITSYSIDAGCEWALMTNGREWRLYHVAFGQPPETREVKSWNLMTDDVADLVESFDLITLRNLKKGSLDDLWQKTSVLLPRNLLEAIVCEDTIGQVRRQLRKKSGVLLQPEDILKGFRRLLNESAATELEDVVISLPKKKRRRSSRSDGASSAEDPSTTDAEAREERVDAESEAAE